jgi:hypothetical protein|tara:strand:+ start:363 stop:527 length:165 start_codon:yes stop_codon:yes gene_type:complete
MSLAKRVLDEIVNQVTEWSDTEGLEEFLQDLSGLEDPDVKKIMRNFLFNSGESE